MKESAWIQLRKRIELNFRPGLLIGESKQPEFETALTLVFQPKFNSHSFSFFSSFIIKSKFLNPYAPILFEYCNVDAWSSILMLVHDIQSPPVKLSLLPCSSNMKAESGNLSGTISQTNRSFYRTRLNDMKASETSNHLIKFPAFNKNHQQVNSKPDQQNTLITNYSIPMENNSKNHNELMIMTKLIPPPHSPDKIYLPDTYRKRTSLTNNDTHDSITITENKNKDHIFTPEETPIRRTFQVLTMYKRVDKKVQPILVQLPEECYICRNIPEDPLLTMNSLPFNPPEFKPTKKITIDQMKILNVNAKGFLSPEEEKLFKHIMVINEETIAFEDAERGTLKESYFDPYIMPTVPHIPWEYRNIPIPPGIKQKVLDLLKLKVAAEVYEQSQSSYQSPWFVVLKKSGKLRIVHDLQPLNRITIWDAGTLPILDDFVNGFAGRQCYTVFDLYSGYDARKIHPRSRELTAFMTPLGMLQLTTLLVGYTNSPAEFQKCMVMVLQDEIPDTANIFIDDLPIKGPTTQYLDKNGKPEVLKENPGIRQFIWEHAQDVHRIMHKIKCAGATFAATKAQICLSEVLIIGQTCNANGRVPENSKVDKILNWPPLTTPKEVRRFLGLCGGLRIWIPNYSKIVRPLTQLYHKDAEFIWNKERQIAFDEIKKSITTASALRPIDYTVDNAVILAVDSSTEATGMILYQMNDDGKI